MSHDQDREQKTRNPAESSTEQQPGDQGQRRRYHGPADPDREPAGGPHAAQGGTLLDREAVARLAELPLPDQLVSAPEFEARRGQLGLSGLLSDTFRPDAAVALFEEQTPRPSASWKGLTAKSDFCADTRRR